MKQRQGKPFTGILLVCMLLVLSACGGGNSSGGSGGEGTVTGGAGEAESGIIAKIKERGKLVAGVKYDTKLFGLKDPGTGVVEGFDVDMAKALAKKLIGDETKLELKEVTSKTRMPMLNNGEIDLIIATMTITEDRKKEVDFSDVYFKAGQSLLVKKGSPIRSIDDVTADTKVLGVKGATSIKNIEEKVDGLRVQQYENYQEAFTALRAGQGEVLTTDNAILFGMSQQDPNYEVVGGTFTDEPYGIAVKKGETGLVEAVNELLKEMKDSGEYAKQYEKWMGEAPPAE
ncbi:amino acid ABC transporter substrate-binding protein [Paenibacillus darwinianus]|uniref:Amino acid ABC transporter substrate-binding protein n=1 Tax=Paenibacillus darwinianus TaxID=1380763 RepID=A0A9W5S0J5_9BACL|nr:transporter substrate-binding domain-containing protein [Paenibacillus darwinianus]EXX86770.1 amino acid ABC transporter substrate-binding protein [Paenibacillus darwinianus]EXX87082.1 amino acid ABC transporter substrate-binding protein [Paenibacillus darwinianus]EXX87280.1 amino acid ABC transporter substrate-binding protein [Paenibacillus darwinianus]